MDSLYVPLLSIHNILRWVVVIAALYALYTYITGWLQGREYRASDRQAGVFFTISMDIQLVIGLILYGVVSPITRAGFSDFGAAMTNSDVRYFLVEHILLMVVAVVLVHVGSVMVRKAVDSRVKFQRGTIWYVLSTLVVLASIPWWRPLLRLPF
ncbi:MAG: hypothetical protein WDZ49_14960 [Litorilinea sp.]